MGYHGSSTTNGDAHGAGQLFYFDGLVFVGTFQYGAMWRGVVYASGDRPRCSMEDGRWTGFSARPNLVEEFPSSLIQAPQHLDCLSILSLQAAQALGGQQAASIAPGNH